MEIKQRLSLTQKPQLVMTQQLQQALKLLQVPTLELQQILKEELEGNPMLEELDDSQEGEDAAAQKTESTEAQERESQTREDGRFDLTDFYQDSWESDYRERPDTSREYYERVPVTKVSFHEGLLASLRLNVSDQDVLSVGEYVIGSLDDRGFLTSTTAEIAQELEVAEELVERALSMIQALDPPGIGARDLPESLLLQLEAKGQGESLAASIIRGYFKQLTEKKYTEIAKGLRVGVQEVQAAADAIAGLSPSPGLEYSAEDPKYVTPDLVVERVDDDYAVYLNDRNIPRLRVSQAYERILRDSKGDAKTKEYINEKLSSAKWLIQTIEQRRRTMVKVMTSIVKAQRDFFDKGISHLKPLTLQEVAREIGMHESTVSRVTSNKYAQTPRGVFRLKYFFSSGLETETGEEVSAKTAKNILAELIENENKSKPLSDQELAEELKKRGLRIARRTVAKYRDQLKVLPARYRKRH